MIRYLTLLLTLFLSSSILAQEKDSIAPGMKLLRVHPITVKAEVIGVLEGTKDLAVVQIKEIGENEWEIGNGDEILVKFQFGTGPFYADQQLPGVKSGDVISAELYSRLNANSVQFDHTILRYQVLNSTPKTKP